MATKSSRSKSAKTTPRAKATRKSTKRAPRKAPRFPVHGGKVINDPFNPDVIGIR